MTVGLLQSEYFIQESVSELLVCAMLTGLSEIDVAVSFSTMDGTAQGLPPSNYSRLYSAIYAHIWYLYLTVPPSFSTRWSRL